MDSVSRDFYTHLPTNTLASFLFNNNIISSNIQQHSTWPMMILSLSALASATAKASGFSSL